MELHARRTVCFEGNPTLSHTRAYRMTLDNEERQVESFPITVVNRQSTIQRVDAP